MCGMTSAAIKTRTGAGRGKWRGVLRILSGQQWLIESGCGGDERSCCGVSVLQSGQLRETRGLKDGDQMRRGQTSPVPSPYEITADVRNPVGLHVGDAWGLEWGRRGRLSALIALSGSKPGIGWAVMYRCWKGWRVMWSGLTTVLRTGLDAYSSILKYTTGSLIVHNNNNLPTLFYIVCEYLFLILGLYHSTGNWQLIFQWEPHLFRCVKEIGNWKRKRDRSPSYHLFISLSVLLPLSLIAKFMTSLRGHYGVTRLAFPTVMK